MKKNKFETLLVHAGEKPDPISGAIAPVLVRSKTYRQASFGKEAEYQYSRGKNPTRNILEEKVAALEGDGQATVFASGNAAVTMFLLTLTPGDHIVFCKEVYGGTYRILETVFKKYNIAYDFVDVMNREQLEKAITPSTKYIFVETISNPSLHVVDLRVIQALSKKYNVPFVVDATFSPPCSLQAFEYGAETVIHSLSKYCAGHNDVIAGALITRNKELHLKLKGLQRSVGAVLSPDECYRVIQGLKTLSLRWQRVSDTAHVVANYLYGHKKIKKVLYPGLVGHPYHRAAQKQFRGGSGAVVSFELDTTSLKKVKKFVEKVCEGGIITYGESLASPESLLAYPAFMSHRALPEKDRIKLGISASFFRFSVGFEDSKDIVECFKKALSCI